MWLELEQQNKAKQNLLLNQPLGEDSTYKGLSL